MKTFEAFVVRKGTEGITASVENLSQCDLPQEDVLLRVDYASLNFKDALATQGHPGVVRTFPHVPGIDAAGVVEESQHPDFDVGDEVLVTGYDFGAAHWGGLSQYMRVPGDWIVKRPRGFSARDAMIYGTAGFTAAQSVAAIIEHGIKPEAGEVLVTGASGGVGCIAVGILAKLGYHVVAGTGKESAKPLLTKLGAKEFVSREDLVDSSDKPLLPSRWAAAVDTVGGNTLTTILRSTQHRACVTACGLVGGIDLPLTVHPFILRGVTLAGIDSAKCPMQSRLEMWNHLSGDWNLDNFEPFVTSIRLNEVPQTVGKLLQGQARGRTIVELV